MVETMKVTYVEWLRGSIKNEIEIETQDKINFIEYGMNYNDVMELTIDDFTILRELLYKCVEVSKTKISVTDIRKTLDYIDDSINDSVDYIIKKSKERRVESENRFNEDIRRNVERKRFDRRNN